MSTRSVIEDRWRKIIHEQGASGMSVLAFCRQAGIAQSSFFNWRRKFRDAATFAEVKLVAKRGQRATESPGGTQQAQKAESAADAGAIEVRLSDRRSIIVRPGFDYSTLLEVLRILETSSAATTMQGVGV